MVGVVGCRMGWGRSSNWDMVVVGDCRWGLGMWSSWVVVEIVGCRMDWVMSSSWGGVEVERNIVPFLGFESDLKSSADYVYSCFSTV